MDSIEYPREITLKIKHWTIFEDRALGEMDVFIETDNIDIVVDGIEVKDLENLKRLILLRDDAEITDTVLDAVNDHNMEIEKDRAVQAYQDKHRFAGGL